MTIACAYHPLDRFDDAKVTTQGELVALAVDMTRTTAAHAINTAILEAEKHGLQYVSLDLLRLLAEQIAKIRIPTSSP